MLRIIGKLLEASVNLKIILTCLPYDSCFHFILKVESLFHKRHLWACYSSSASAPGQQYHNLNQEAPQHNTLIALLLVLQRLFCYFDSFVSKLRIKFKILSSSSVPNPMNIFHERPNLETLIVCFVVPGTFQNKNSTTRIGIRKHFLFYLSLN